MGAARAVFLANSLRHIAQRALSTSRRSEIKGSSNVNMQPGAIKGVAEYSNDLDQWVANTMAPAFHEAAKKIAEKEGIAGRGLRFPIAKAGRNKNTQRLMHMWGDPEFLRRSRKIGSYGRRRKGSIKPTEPCSAIRRTRRAQPAA